MTVPHIYKVRARYADTDPMGVVYHGRYFEWFEAARTELLRDEGMPYLKMEEDGISLPVVEVYCRYRRSVIYDEAVRVKTTIGELTRSRIRLDYEIIGEKENETRVQGYTIHCYLDGQGRPIRAPKELFAFLWKIYGREKSE